MKLAEYLELNEIKRTDFAEKIGKSQSYITQLCQGQIWPSHDVMVAIFEATDGQVTANDFIKTPTEAA